MTHTTDFRLPFHDRSEAGRLLAEKLQSYANRADTVVLALPRGGVPIGAEIAAALAAPLFVFTGRKLVVPGHSDVAMGAVASGGKALINRAIANALHISEDEINLAVAKEMWELRRRELLYCRGHEMSDVKNKIVILTDDGVATGSSMLLAAQVLRSQGAAYVLIAVPVAPAEIVSQLYKAANQVICLAEPDPFISAGKWYEDFHQLTDHEVCLILDRSFQRTPELQSA